MISLSNQLFRRFVQLDAVNLCVSSTALCTVCQSPVAGVCAATCGVAPCPATACADSGCAGFLAGLRGAACQVHVGQPDYFLHANHRLAWSRCAEFERANTKNGPSNVSFDQWQTASQKKKPDQAQENPIKHN